MIKNATEVVLLCENVLGFTHPEHLPLFKSRAIEAGKIKKKLAKEPDVTLDDLALAVEFCRRKREAVKSPAALFWRVKEAREMANDVVVVTDLTAEVQRAVNWELAQATPNDEWLGRLVRANGPIRQEVLHDWAAAGRG